MEIVFRASVIEGPAPYGLGLSIDVPLIKVLPEASDASAKTAFLTIGAHNVAYYKRCTASASVMPRQGHRPAQALPARGLAGGLAVQLPGRLDGHRQAHGSLPEPVRTRGRRSGGLRAVLVVAAVALCVAAAVALSVVDAADAVAAATVASIQPFLRPDRLGASTALTLALRFSGGEEASPYRFARSSCGCRRDCGSTARRGGAVRPGPPARGARRAARRERCSGAATRCSRCTPALRRSPSRPVLWVFRGPDTRRPPRARDPQCRAHTPLQQQTISTAVLQATSAPYGSDAERCRYRRSRRSCTSRTRRFVSLSLTIGQAGARRARKRPGPSPFRAAARRAGSRSRSPSASPTTSSAAATAVLALPVGAPNAII